jgi:hypothetical protein
MAYYPLRPELAESTYALYRATGSDRYLEMGREMVISLNQIARTPSGFAAVKSVLDMTLEDHTPSFFLAETLKYLYLLFDDDAFPNTHASGYVFSTEGHIIPISTAFPKQPPITAPALPPALPPGCPCCTQCRFSSLMRKTSPSARRTTYRSEAQSYSSTVPDLPL